MCRSHLWACALVAACAETGAPTHAEIAACARDQAPFSGGVVTRDGEGRLVQDDREVVVRGLGSYPLLEHAGNGRMDEVHEVLARAVALGRPVVRTNAFLDGGESPARIRDENGSLREEGLAGLDRLIAAAAEHRVRLILVLTNNWRDYGGAEAVLRMVAPGEGLPKDAFWSEPRAVEAQRAYIDAIVSRLSSVTGRRHADEPAVLAWELVNEARCDDDAWCDERTLVRWARAMATAVRDAGARQLVAWGGSGHRGAHGEDLDAIAADGAVDVLTVHVWPFASHALHFDPISSGDRIAIGMRIGAETIRDRAALARRHRTPLWVEELGWRGSTGDDRDGERGIVLGAWLRVAREEGVGAVPWMIAERGRPDYDGLLIRPEHDLATVEALRCE